MSDETNTQIIELLREIRDLLKQRPVSSQGSSQSQGEAPAKQYQNETGQWVWQLPKGQKPSSCRYCQQDIFWVKSKKGKNVPCDANGLCHYETCPDKKDKNKKPFVPMPRQVKSVGDGVSDVMADLEDKVPF